METMARTALAAGVSPGAENWGKETCCSCCFQMPLHYPRYTKADYEAMPEWKLDHLFQEYGLSVSGDVAYKRKYAVGAFLWPTY